MQKLGAKTLDIHTERITRGSAWDWVLSLKNLNYERKLEYGLYEIDLHDHAKQIFKELDAIAWEQIEPSRLEEFYEQFSNAKDLKASLNVATAFSIIGLDAEKYEALKKKYNIEE